jgi:hypothetical protein
MSKKQKEDTVIKDIPFDSTGNFLYYYSKKKELESKMDLSSMENGVDSIEIRIWYGIAFSDSLNLVVLKENKFGWKADVFFLKYDYSKSRDSIISVSSKKQAKTPKSGWASFTKELFNLEILSLIDCSKIKEYGDCTDGYGITIEVATADKYRIYQYTCFRGHDKVWQTKNIENAMSLISNEFDFHWIEMPS